MKHALIVGGTGLSGPLLVNGVCERGYTVAVLHRGTQEIPEIGPDIENIHADSHFRETLAFRERILADTDSRLLQTTPRTLSQYPVPPEIPRD